MRGIYLSRLLIVLGFALAAVAGLRDWVDWPGQERMVPAAPLAKGKRPDRPDEAFKFRVLQTQDERKTDPRRRLIPGADKIDGTLDAAPESTFAVELFVSDVCDPLGHGEGRTYLGKVDVATDANGHGTFTFSLPISVTTGDFITSTATDAVGNTSEFSACVEVTPVRIGSIGRQGNGPMRLQGIGVPNEQHTVEILPSLRAPPWLSPLPSQPMRMANGSTKTANPG